MTLTQTRSDAPARPVAPACASGNPSDLDRTAVSRPWDRVWTIVLGVVSLVFGLSQTGVWRIGLGWDESIYASQVTPGIPPAFFSAPRARGITWLAAPLTHFTGVVPDLRVYLTVASSLALMVAYRVWFRVLPPAAVVTAAAAFAGLWITRFYGAELMPNLWVAFGAVLSVGGFLRVAQSRWDVVGLVSLPAGLGVAALMRPTDAAWVAAALLLCGLCGLASSAWRRNLPVLGALTVAGSAAGALPWVLEAHQRFGGVAARLRAASAIQGGLGWHPEVLGQHLRTIDGPLLCRPCNPPATLPISAIWLLAVPAAVLVLLLALLVAVGNRRPVSVGAVVVPVVAGAAVAVPYLLLIGYSAPRFLLPALGLLALPVGAGAHTLVTGAARLAGRAGRIGAAVTVTGLLAVGATHLVVQQRVLDGEIASSTTSTASYADVAAALRRDGVTVPCLVSGRRSPQIAFYTGCASRNVNGHDASITPEALKAAASRQAVIAVVEPGHVAPGYVKQWLRRSITVPGHTGAWTFFTPSGGAAARSSGWRARPSHL